jgi:hypothetical protein
MNKTYKFQKGHLKRSHKTDFHSEENYSFILQKELEDDFKVHEYLHEHPNER